MFPDLPGCSMSGDTIQQEAMEMSEDAASGWILTSIGDGESLPAAYKSKAYTLELRGSFFCWLLYSRYAKNIGKQSLGITLCVIL